MFVKSPVLKPLISSATVVLKEMSLNMSMCLLFIAVVIVLLKAVTFNSHSKL